MQPFEASPQDSWAMSIFDRCRQWQVEEFNSVVAIRSNHLASLVLVDCQQKPFQVPSPKLGPSWERRLRALPVHVPSMGRVIGPDCEPWNVHLLRCLHKDFISFIDS